MRVLRIFHSAVVDAWRERERHLRALGADVDLLTARRWNEGGSDVAARRPPGRAGDGPPHVGTPPGPLRVRAAAAVARPRATVRRHRHPRGAVRPGDRRDPAAAAAAPPAGAVRPVLRPEHRQALPTAVPLARAVGAAPRRRAERVQLRGRPHLRAQGVPRGGHPDPAGRRHRALLARPGRPGGARSPSSGTSAGSSPTRASTCSSRPSPARRRATLRVAGAGPEEAALRARAAELGHRRPRRAGRVAGPGAAARLLPRPRRARGAVDADARLAGAVRPRRRRGDGLRRARSSPATPAPSPTWSATPACSCRRRPGGRCATGPASRCSTTSPRAASWSRRGVEQARQALVARGGAAPTSACTSARTRHRRPTAARGVEVVVVAYGRPDLLAGLARSRCCRSPSPWSTTPPRPTSPPCATRLGVRYLDPGTTAASARASTTPSSAGSTRTPTCCCSTPTR